MAGDTVSDALSQPFFHPWETAHELFWGDKANFKSAYKTTELIWSVVDTLQTVFPETVPSFADLGKTCSTFKNVGKLIEAEGFVSAFGDLIDPNNPDSTHPLAKTAHIPMVVYAVKIGALATATIGQSYLICKKIVHPELFGQLGEGVVYSLGYLSASTGSTQIDAVVTFVTTAGAEPIKNIFLIVFLTIDGYQCVRAFQTMDTSSANAMMRSVGQKLKSAENAGKIICITMCLFGAPSIWIVGVGLATSFLCVSTLYQKQTIPPAPPGGAPAGAADAGEDSDAEDAAG